MSHCTKKKLQKLNPSGNFSQFDPQKFVPANLKRWPIHKIKAHKNFMLHGIRWFFFHPFNWNVIWFPFNVSTLSTFSFLCKAVSLVVHFLPSYISFFFQAKERRHELQKLRALQSYYETKCRRMKKIKSKKYVSKWTSRCVLEVIGLVSQHNIYRSTFII